MLKGFKQTRIIPHFLTFIFSLCFVLFTLKPALTIPPPVREIRGVWLTNIDSDVLFSRRGVTEALNRLKTLNFNTIYPTVWQGGYTLYPSAVAQQYFGQSLDPTPGLQRRDVLQELVTQGHQKGLSVIPWFEFGFMAPANSDLAQQHPDWLTRRLDGTLIKKEGNDERVWLNPFHPEVQQFILDLIAEIVTNYKIDGIQFDDHFGLPSELGYDEYTVNLYQAEHQGKSPSEDFFETYWVRWRADKINQFVKRVFETVKAIDQDCIISLSPNPLHFALPAYLQDWFTWERKGWIEEIVLQVYRPDLERFITELERTEVELAKNHIPFAVGILSGLKNRPTPINTIEKQVQETRQHQLAGVSFFFYESLWNWAEETPAERQNKLQKLFPTQALRPSVYGLN
ncbi:glycoside hydrolase family 10 protein [Limnoraphis robusta Tam1]|uniref:Glycoside hydrolase family 10 protein n=1 Tax=Limnoraphis robusta CCNP1315 TaxID=3110306 RepID=A0ABU5TUQ1_9CYAN|nr:glycoside hydrolase family 10 protein [Limnoraphis robusta]MEA5500523.1 glycoside hydrolase family 10 protein [Limnoraphis robusta BA-68 BA1]MEA5518627.1 glycoside hydrolase family 10 protein [Limnoraphis robusta CCNP1315]MEA5543218.1 glycoside hydrolase family 10 protein [Limnoraphis robusta Tam1]MEA5548507.1 glycoside hydrolase family 10 protein [Limnoraphis robusta CCNP1324]